jgi:hypothetical protein
MKKIIIGILFSFNAFAGYECELKLAHTEDLYKTIAQANISATDRDLRTIHLKEFFIEEKTKRKTISVSVQAAMVGWAGEEEVAVAVFRRSVKNFSIETTSLNRKLSIKGSEAGSLWFENYKLDIKCNLVQ